MLVNIGYGDGFLYFQLGAALGAALRHFFKQWRKIMAQGEKAAPSSWRSLSEFIYAPSYHDSMVFLVKAPQASSHAASEGQHCLHMVTLH